MAEPSKRRKTQNAAAFTAGSAQAGGDIIGRDKAGRDITGRDKYEAGGHIVQAEAGATVIIGAPPTADETPVPGDPPFKGLQYFDERDADLFFGRELLTARLAGQLREHRFLAVVGASGSGKSSAVRAGLVPALKRGEPLADGALPPDGGARWPVHVITPTAHPLEALAASLTRDVESVTATATLMDDLARDPRILHLAARRILSRASADRLLLVVDQFEELFTLCRSEAERGAFVDNLLTAASLETDGPTTVVMALRADFYAHCAQYDSLREALARRQEYIGPMTAEELRRAIEEPARRSGWEFEEGLVDLLLRDAGDEPGALPLLSHALLETWRRRRGRTMTLAGYEETGGVRGAIARTAETVFCRLGSGDQAIARSIFLRLTELGEDSRGTCRRIARSEILPQTEKMYASEAVLKTLIDTRLVTTEKETIEIAHEALIREWPRLRAWLDEDRESLRIQGRLAAATQEWARWNYDPSVLFRGAQLAQALEWVKSRISEITVLERRFIGASRALHVSDLEAAERRAAEQARAEQQAIALPRFRRLSILLAVALLASIGLVILASWQYDLRRGLENNVNTLVRSLSTAFPDWQAQYFDSDSLSGAPVLVRNDRAISFTWGAGAPVPNVSADNFSVRWMRIVHLAAGKYRFTVWVDDGVRVWVDDVNVIERWESGPHTLVQDVNLGAGSHIIKVEMRELTGNAFINLSFESLVQYNCWNAEYFDNRDLTGMPVWISDDGAIHFDWRDNSPNEDKKVPKDNFSVRWTRMVDFAEGVTQFHMYADDGWRLKIDGRTVSDSEWKEGAARWLSVPVELAAGKHEVVLEYFDAAGNAMVAFYIEPPAIADAWSGMYYRGNRLDGIGGYPILMRYDEKLDFDWGTGSPDACGLPPDSFSVRWTRDLQVNRTGQVQFLVIADDRVRIFANNQLVRDEQHPGESITYNDVFDLVAGVNRIDVDYFEQGGLARIYVGVP